MSKYVDMAGQHFYNYTVLEKTESYISPKGAYVTMWKCQCDCGKIFVTSRDAIRQGHTQSCGCLKKQTRNPQFEDLTGRKFGRLTVVRFLRPEERENKRNAWLCRCDCGNYRQVNATKLKAGTTKSCGCAKAERIGKLNRKYAIVDKKLYGVYKMMIDRCCNKENRMYKNYGGRGITVCDEWLDKEHGFDKFAEWALNNGRKEGLTLDRIDSNGNYEPANCRWITNKEQQNNKTNNVRITYEGVTHTVAEWSEILNIPYDTIHNNYRAGNDLNHLINKEQK